MYEPILEKIGLNSTEGSAYEAMIELGKATPAEVAKISKLSRVNAYQVLPKLESLGLIQKIADSKKLEYTVTSPDILFDLLEKKEQEVLEIKNSLKDIINQIEPKINIAQNKPVVRYFGGDEGAKEAYVEFIEGVKEKKMYGITNRSKDVEFVNLMETIFVTERLKKKIFLNLIVTDQRSFERFAENAIENKREVKIRSSTSFPEGTYILFEKERLLIITKQQDEEKNMGIIIEHKDIVKTAKAMFDLLWE